MVNDYRILTLALLTASTLFFQSRSARAAIFKNEYVSFELADRWKCNFEQTEWICRTNTDGASEAIIILAAKQVGPQDSLAAYEKFLKMPRKITSRTGQPLMSTVYQVRQETINGQVWVDGFHFGSEIPNYYTRYLASMKDKIAVLVTFSAHKLHFTQYSADFFHAIQSLNVVITKLPTNGSGNYDGSSGMVGGSLDTIIPTDGGNVYGEAGGEGTGMDDQTKSLLGAVIVIGAIGFYMVAKKGGGGSNKKRRR